MPAVMLFFKTFFFEFFLIFFDFFGKFQVPTSKNFADLVDVSGESYDFFVVGLQEAPHFDVKTAISEVLGDKYWWESCPL